LDRGHDGRGRLVQGAGAAENEVDTGRPGTQKRNGHETGGGGGFVSASRRRQWAAGLTYCTEHRYYPLGAA